MPEPLSADRTAEMLLWYFEQPTRYHTEGRRRDAPFLDPEVILKLALGRSAGLNTASRRGAESAAMLQAAAAMYVHHLFFRPEATPYQTLGLLPGASEDAIKESFRLLMQLVHPDRQDAKAQWPDALAAQANRAYGILRNEDSRAQFDREAASRAAMERAMDRADAASASKFPVAQRAQPRSGRRQSAPAHLPEWLTNGVGRHVRKHPAATSFALFTALALITVGVMVSEQQESRLTRDAQDIQQHALPKAKAMAPAIASAARVSDEASLPGPSATSNRPEPAGAVPSRNAASPPVADRASADRSTARATDAAVQPLAPAPPLVVALPAAAPPLAASPAEAAPAASPPTSQAESAVAKARPAVPEPAITTPMPSPPPIARAEPPAPIRPSVLAVGVAPSAPDAARGAPASGTPVAAAPPGPRPEPVATVAAPVAAPSPPAATEIEALFVTFVDTYERGRVDAFAALFDENADTNIRRGRAAIRGEYDELFRLSDWRKMQLTHVNWRHVGDRAIGKGEITVKIGWRDGREVEQRLAVDLELVRRDGRVVIARLAHHPKN